MPALAQAQSDTGQVNVTVLDAVSGKPVRDARVILVGPTTASALSTKAGGITYTDVPTGIYRLRVDRLNYLGETTKEFEVQAGRATDVGVQLAPTDADLKIIGSVKTHGTVTISSSEINDTSAVRRVSDSLTDTLDKVAGVNVTQTSSDPDSGVAVSLRGRDEAQTALTLDGVPLAAPGSVGDLSHINADLFGGASVNFAPTSGSIGGGLNFRTLQPTQTWQLHGAASWGTFDKATYRLATTGTLGRLGIALEHTFRDANNPLTFRIYQDQSGLTYAHGGESHTTGDLVKLRYSLNDRTTISGTALASNRYNTALCTQFVTLLPCGIGPGNWRARRYGFASANIETLIGQVSTQLTGFANSSSNIVDDLQRRVAQGPAAAPAPLPALSRTQGYARGGTLSARISHRRHTVTVSGTTYDSVDSSTPQAGSPFETAYTNAVSSVSYQISDAFKSSERLTVTPRVSVATTTGSGTSLLGGLAAGWQPTQVDAVAGSLTIGSAQPGTNVTKSFTDPNSAQMNCLAGTAIVGGPGDSAGPQSSFGADASIVHQMGRGQVTVAAYTQRQQGQLIQILVNQSALLPAYFPTGYLAAVQQRYAQPTVCNGGVPTVYVSAPLGGTRRTYEGIDLSGRLALGSNVVILPTYAVNIAKLTSVDSPLLLRNSPVIVGSQLPGRPLHRAGLTIDAVHGASATESTINAQYTSSGNYQHLGPYIVASAGLTHRFGPGTLTLFETNIFGTYTADFTTNANAEPLPLSNGGSLKTGAHPLAPRTLSVNYSFAFGGEAGAHQFPAAQNEGAAPGQAAAQQQVSARVRSVPPPPGVDPLALPAPRTACTTDAQNTARGILDELRAFVAAFEKKSPPPAGDRLLIAPHTLSRGPIAYYLELHSKATPTLPTSPGLRGSRALLRCAYVTPMTRAQARSKGIDVPSSGRAAYYYVPSLGVVRVHDARLPSGGGSIRGS